MSGIPQRLVQGSVLFNIFISDKDSRSECTLNRIMEDTKLCCQLDVLEGSDAIQRDSDRLERCVQANLMKCEVLHLVWGILKQGVDEEHS